MRHQYGKGLFMHTSESRIESGMSSHYWMSKANKRRELVFARGNSPPEIRRSVCARVEKNQTGRERDPLPVWAHTSNKTSKVEKKIPYKCSTSSIPSKSCQSQRMEEKTGGEGTCRLSQPVQGYSHGA